MNSVPELLAIRKNILRHRLVGFWINGEVVIHHRWRHAVGCRHFDDLLSIQHGKVDAHRIVEPRVVTVEHLRNEYFSVLVIEQERVRSAETGLIARVGKEDETHAAVADEIEKVIAAEPRFFLLSRQRSEEHT